MAALKPYTRFAIVAGGTAARGGLALVFQLMLARVLPLADYGHLVAGLAVINLITPLASFGIPALWIKRLGEGLSDRGWILRSLAIAGMTCLIAASLAMIWSLNVGYESRAFLVIVFLLPSIPAQVLSDLVSAIFQVNGRILEVSISQNVLYVARFIGCLGLFYISNLQAVSAGLFAAGLVVAIGFFILLTRLCTHFGRNSGSKTKCENDRNCRQSTILIVRAAAPFAFADIIYAIYTQFATVTLSAILNPEDIAALGLTLTLMTGVYMIPIVVYQRLYLHHFHRLALHDRRELANMFRTNVFSMFFIGCLVVLVVWLFAAIGMAAVFGNGHSTAKELLMIVALGIPARFAGIPMLNVLATGGYIGRRNIMMLIGSIILVGSMLITGKAFGVLGVGWVMVVGDYAFSVAYLAVIQFKYFATRTA